MVLSRGGSRKEAARLAKLPYRTFCQMLTSLQIEHPREDGKVLHMHSANCFVERLTSGPVPYFGVRLARTTKGNK